MTDEPTGVQGQPVPDVAPVSVMTAPASEQAPATAPAVTPPGKYNGKTPEELAQELEEKDRYITEINERAARAEHEAALTRNLVDQFARDRGRVEPAPSAPQVTDDEFLTNPAKATSKIIEGYFERERKEREREKAEQYVNTARNAYEAGKAEAVKGNPDLYRGIEADLSREVFNTVQASLRAGQPVDAGALRDPRYWEAAAVAFRIMRGEDVAKYYGRKTTPMAPVHQETPSPGGMPQAVPVLSESEKAGAKFFGLTDEQWIATKQKMSKGQ